MIKKDKKTSNKKYWLIGIVIFLVVLYVATNVDFNKPKSPKTEVVTHPEVSNGGNVSMEGGVLDITEILTKNMLIFTYLSMGVMLCFWIYRMFNRVSED
jgi:hypothetical protein